LQLRWIKPSAGQSVLDLIHEAGTPKLHWRHVDRYGAQARPLHRLPTRLVQHPFTYAGDQPSFLREWDECVRQNLTASRMVPADQRLSPYEPTLGQIELRLIVQAELALFERLDNIRFERATLQQLRVHFSGKESIDTATVFLGSIKGGVR